MLEVKADKKIKEFRFSIKKPEVLGNRLRPGNDFIKFEKKDIYQTIVNRFEEQVEKTPQKIAIKTQQRELTYKELNEKSNHVKREILRLYGDRKECVALLFEHGLDIIISIMGVLKSGRYYIPLDSTFPIKRLIYMLKDSDATILLTNNVNIELADKLLKEAENDIQLLNLDAIDNVLSLDSPSIQIDPEDLAYILYTSGSTGTPKGVPQSHLYVLHLIYSFTNSIQISSADHITLLPPFSFSASVMDLFGALLNGATIHPMDARNELISNLLFRIRSEKISIYHSVPTLFRYLVKNKDEDFEFPDIRLIYLAGEQLLKSDADLFKEFFSDQCLLVNGMGCTEFNICRQFFLDKKTEVKTQVVPVGYPALGAEILLFNEAGDIVGHNHIGEIGVKSKFLPSGYWRRSDLSKGKFLSIPGSPDEQIYMTGDLGRMTLDGCLMHLGRKDSQLKIRGQRVEIAEIEYILDKVEGISKSVVKSHKDKSGENYLIAYYIKEKEIDESSIITELKELLPGYMVPCAFINVSDFSYTTSGKIDRNALPEPDLTEKLTNEEGVALRDEIEVKLSEIWAEVLNIDKGGIGIDSNFFELGGHSLKATILVSKIHKELHVKIPLAEIFRTPTIREVSEYIKEEVEDKCSLIEPVEKREYYELSSAQERMYFLQHMELKSTAYNMPFVVRLKGELDNERLETTFKQLVKRHECLRTSFERVEGKPVQKIHNNLEFSVEYYEAGNMDQDLWVRNIEEIIHNFVQPFDLSQVPLLRVGLIKEGEVSHILMVDMHHILSDVQSDRM